MPALPEPGRCSGTLLDRRLGLLLRTVTQKVPRSAVMAQAEDEKRRLENELLRKEVHRTSTRTCNKPDAEPRD